MDCSKPGLPVHHQLLELTQTHVHRVGDAIQPSHPLLSPLLLPSIFASIRVFFSESFLCIRWPKYWSLSFSISPSNEHSGLNSFRMDWLDLLAVRGILKSLLQHHSSKESILQRSAFFIVCWVRLYKQSLRKRDAGGRMRNKTQEFSERRGSGDQHRSKVKVPKLNPCQLYYTLSHEGRNVQGVKQ